MAKDRTLTNVTETILKLKKRLAAKQKAHEEIRHQIKGMYRQKVVMEQTPTEAAYHCGEQIDEDCEVLERECLRLPHEISALTDLIEETKKEVLDLAQAEIEKIPEQIAAMQASLLKKRESILHELMETLERVSLLHWQLNGVRIRIPFFGNLILPALPQELIIESNVRLDILFKDQPREGDPYAIELKVRELKERQARGAQEITKAAMANAGQ